MICAVVFDVGETLVDETRQWQTTADALGVSLFTLAGVVGGVIERRQDHRQVWSVFGAEHTSAIDQGYRHEARDLYPDAVPALMNLRDAGYRLGISGNQPEGAVEQIEALGLPVDLIASSTAWGVHKPDPAFFARIVQELGLPPAAIAYVGDRLDNDVLPAQRAGMTGIFIRRGPWGYLHAAWPEMQQVPWRIESLVELPGLLASMNERETADT